MLLSLFDLLNFHLSDILRVLIKNWFNGSLKEDSPKSDFIESEPFPK
nr:MAG TPA: hypothetical protein [Bacteriophage sp.]